MEIYSEISKSRFNDAVGGGDAHHVAQLQTNILKALPHVHFASSILDFGCGIGRTMPLLHQQLERPALQLDGCDISADFIAESRKIHANLPYRFFHIAGTNHHYLRFGADRGRDKLPANTYNFAYSFSVFTHLGVEAAAQALDTVRRTLKPGGCYYFTLFQLDDEAIDVINKNRSLVFKFNKRTSKKDEAFFAHDDDPLAFAALSHSAMERLLAQNGFVVNSYIAGSWRSILAMNLHDAFLVRKVK